MKNNYNITFISDTHNRHRELTNDLPGGDMIIHSGDISGRGTLEEIRSFLLWFERLPYTHKIFIAGNHDFGFEELRHSNQDEFAIRIPDNVIYLQDEMVEVDGLKIYGSPWQPRFYDWAFNVDRGDAIAKKWEPIPEGLDILITHGPVFGILDDTYTGMRVGCEELYKKVVQVKPRIHVCGHIHWAYGMRDFNDTTFINASSLGENYQYQNKPIVVDYNDYKRD